MLQSHHSVSAATSSHNRIAAIMIHCQRYMSYGTTRLAADAGVAKSTISFLVRGKANPLYNTAVRIVNCFERELGRRLDMRDVFSVDGSYPTKHVCETVGCKRCLPDWAFENDGSRKQKWRGVLGGQWTGDVNEIDREFNLEEEELTQ